MRHDKLPRAKARPVTSRRVKAAERALKRERDEHPLFADQVAQEQPTAEQRVQQLNGEQVEYWQRIRDHAARDAKDKPGGFSLANSLFPSKVSLQHRGPPSAPNAS